MVSQITSLTIVYSTVYSGADKKNIKAPRHWPLRGEFTDEFPAQRASTTENVSSDDVIMSFVQSPNTYYGLSSWALLVKLLSGDNVTDHFWWWVNIGLDNGLLSPGNKPLSEAMLSHTSAAICRH